MFLNCNSLSILPDISKWKFSDKIETDYASFRIPNSNNSENYVKISVDKSLNNSIDNRFEASKLKSLDNENKSDSQSNNYQVTEISTESYSYSKNYFDLSNKNNLNYEVYNASYYDNFYE